MIVDFTNIECAVGPDRNPIRVADLVRGVAGLAISGDRLNLLLGGRKKSRTKETDQKY